MHNAIIPGYFWSQDTLIWHSNKHLLNCFLGREFEKHQAMKRLPWWLKSKQSACNAGDVGLIPGLGRSPGEGNDNPL